MIRTVVRLLFVFFLAAPAHAAFLLIPDSGKVATGGLLEVTLFVPNESATEELAIELPARLTLRTRGVAAVPDIVLKPAESQQMFDALHALGRTVELLVFDDDGHEIVKRENRAVLVEAMTRWLTKVFDR